MHQHPLEPVEKARAFEHPANLGRCRYQVELRRQQEVRQRQRFTGKERGIAEQAVQYVQVTQDCLGFVYPEIAVVEGAARAALAGMAQRP